jgi:hypothetical protein
MPIKQYKQRRYSMKDKGKKKKIGYVSLMKNAKKKGAGIMAACYCNCGCACYVTG